MTKVTRICIIDGKPRKIIVEDGNVTNRNPTKEELKDLGIELHRHGNSKYTNRQLLDFIPKYVKEYGNIPQERDFVNIPWYPSFRTYVDRFGSWNKALEFTLDIKRIKYSNGNLTEEELINDLKQFEKENGRPPTARDFTNNSAYHSFKTYQTVFGSWSKALKKAALDVDTTVKKGILDTSQQKARLFEMYVIEHFENKPKDLSGENQNSPCGGICPKGKIYDVKSSNLRDNSHYRFDTRNKYREEIEYYYFGAFNSDWTILEHVWRVPGELVEKDYFIIK